MRYLLSVFVLIIFTTLTYAQRVISGGPLKPEQAAMDIQHYTISLDVNPAEKEIKGYTQAEMAEEFNLPLGTVKTRMRLAMKELRNLLKIT